MAKTSLPLLAIFLLFHIMITLVVARPVIQDKNLKKPDWLKHDRGYLIPGVGRGIKPKCKDNPLTFNPVTGGHGGNLGHVPTFPRVGGRRSFVPGGDDTFVPNPGFEVPNPGNGGSSPGPTSK